VSEPLDPAVVAALAAIAGLPLDDDRVAALAPALGGLFAAADALSRQMSDPVHQDVGPVTVFAHPVRDTGDVS
jgi:hypothetical protein